MKRKLLIALSLILCLSAVLLMAGCGGDEEGSSDKGSAKTDVKVTDLGVSVEEAVKNAEANGNTAIVVTVYAEDQADGAVLSIGEAKDGYETICVNDLSIKDQVLAMPVAPRALAVKTYEEKILANAGDNEFMLGANYTSNGTNYGLDAEVSESDINRVADVLTSIGFTAEDMFDGYVENGIVPTPNSKLLAEVLSADNCEFTEEDGNLTITKYIGTSQNIVVPAEIDGKPVVKIADGAFTALDIHALTTSENLTTIESNAFSNAYGMFNATFASTVDSIGEDAFKNLLFAKSEGDFTVFADVLAVGYNGDAADVTVPEGIQYLGAGIFAGNKTLTNVTLPEGLLAIGDKAFYQCEALNNVVLPEGLVKVGAQAFFANRAFTEITLPASLVEVGNEAFKDCSNALTVNLNDGLKKIGDGAFVYTMFKEDSSLSTTLKIPASVEYIGSSAFAKCNGITEVEGGENLTFLGHLAFEETPWFVSFCSGKEFAVFNGILINYTGKDADVVLPAEVTGIAGAFENAKSVKTITINDGCTFIAEKEFLQCAQLTEITIPASVTVIGDNILDESKVNDITVKCDAGSVAEEYAKAKLFIK